MAENGHHMKRTGGTVKTSIWKEKKRSHNHGVNNSLPPSKLFYNSVSTSDTNRSEQSKFENSLDCSTEFYSIRMCYLIQLNLGNLVTTAESTLLTKP